MRPTTRHGGHGSAVRAEVGAWPATLRCPNQLRYCCCCLPWHSAWWVVAANFNWTERDDLRRELFARRKWSRDASFVRFGRAFYNGLTERSVRPAFFLIRLAINA